MRLADGTLLAPAAVLEASSGTVEAPDRVVSGTLTPGHGRRVALWAVAMTRDGVPSRLAGPVVALTGPPPLVAPELTVTSAGGSDSVAVVRARPSRRCSRSSAAATAVRPGVRSARGCPSGVTSFAVPSTTGDVRYRASLRAAQGRSATGPEAVTELTVSFTAPIDPAGWTLTTPGPLTVPAGLRYAGVRLPQLRAGRPTAAQVWLPAFGTLRSVTPTAGPDAGRTFVEVQVNPFPIRHAVQAVPFGLPTFYVVFDVGSSPVAFADGDTAPGGEPLATVAAVSILCAGQDRVARDPALWASQILAAIPPADRGAWQPFADGVAVQTASGTGRPILVLDHRGAPLESGRVEIRSGSVTATAELIGADGGDLQRTVTRMHAASPGSMPLTSVLPAGGGAARLRPVVAGADVQVARLEDAIHSDGGAIEVTPDLRHIALTNLRSWFAPQFASPPEPLQRYTRNNRLVPLVNGREYYDHLFRALHDAAKANRPGGLHLVGGWQTFPDTELTERRTGEPDDLPLSLEQAAELIGAEGGATRFLSPKFIQLDAGSPIEIGEISLFSYMIMGLLRGKNVDFLRTDAGGAIILLALFVINVLAVTWIIDTDGSALEPNKDAVEVLGAIQNAVSRYSPHPAIVDDNPASPPLSGVPYDQFFKLIRHFGVYHQKFAVVDAGAERFGYAGGIDINPNRLDDIRHVARGPYHDVHALVRGRPCATSSCRSRSAGRATAAASRSPSSPRRRATTGPGTDVVQVARTYFRAAHPSRAAFVGACRRQHDRRDDHRGDRPGPRVHLHRGPVLHAASGLPGRAAGQGRERRHPHAPDRPAVDARPALRRDATWRLHRRPVRG